MAFGSPDSFVMNPKVYTINVSPFIKFCCTLTNPSCETKSHGLPADAQLAAFFARRLESLS